MTVFVSSEKEYEVELSNQQQLVIREINGRIAIYHRQNKKLWWVCSIAAKGVTTPDLQNLSKDSVADLEQLTSGLAVSRPLSRYEQRQLRLLANAMKTHANSLGHFKAAQNQRLIDEYKKILQRRGVPIPTDEELFEVGKFNGEGSF